MGCTQPIRSNGLRMTSRFREIELGAMGFEESSVGMQAMFVWLAQYRPCKRGIIRMLQKVRPAKLIIATHRLKRNQMSIEQRVQVTTQQNTVADNLRLGTRVVLDMRSFERFVDIATRDGASTGIGLKELRAETLLTDSLATQDVANLFFDARRGAGKLHRDWIVLHVAHIGAETRIGSTSMDRTVQYKPAVLWLITFNEG